MRNPRPSILLLVFALVACGKAPEASSGILTPAAPAAPGPSSPVLSPLFRAEGSAQKPAPSSSRQTNALDDFFRSGGDSLDDEGLPACRTPGTGAPTVGRHRDEDCFEINGTFESRGRIPLEVSSRRAGRGWSYSFKDAPVEGGPKRSIFSPYEQNMVDYGLQISANGISSRPGARPAPYYHREIVCSRNSVTVLVGFKDPDSGDYRTLNRYQFQRTEQPDEFSWRACTADGGGAGVMRKVKREEVEAEPSTPVAPENPFANAPAPSPAVRGENLLGLALNEDGTPKLLTAIDAEAYCRAVGAHLPTARELAIYARQRGADGPSTSAETNFYEQFRAGMRTAAGVARHELFYYSRRNYHRPPELKDEPYSTCMATDPAHRIWSSSPVVGEDEKQTYALCLLDGHLESTGIDDTLKLGVRCAR